MNKLASIFRSSEGRNLALTFALVTSLFLLWGFCNGMIDILNKHFQETLHISKFQSGFVQFANYIAYFLMAIPAGLLAKRFGYKGGILIGLALIALGAFWFIPATCIGAYWAFLAGLFIIAAGMTCLETIANPYATLLGPSESGALRLNLAQSFNGIGWILGPVVGGQFVFVTAEGSNASGSLYIPYLGVGIAVLLLMIIFVFAYVPDLQDQEVVPVEDKGKAAVPITHHRNFVFGVIAQFAYVAAQTGIFSFFINYVVENGDHITAGTASKWLGVYGFGLFLLGRICGSGVISITKPQKALAAFALINIALVLLAITGGGLGLRALFGTFFFMSIMVPTIFALGIHGLGSHAKLGSSLIVMSIVGGAVAPPLMGKIADLSSMRMGFILTLVCFAVVALYGLTWERLSAASGGTVAVGPGGH